MNQIRWFSELSLFNFDIKYRTGKLNQAADTLSCCPKTNSDIFSDNESDEYETILYAVVCDDLCDMIEGEKSPLDIKRTVQEEMKNWLPESEKISAHSKMVDILSKVPPGIMKVGQEEAINISKTIYYVRSGKKPTLAQICKIK